MYQDAKVHMVFQMVLLLRMPLQLFFDFMRTNTHNSQITQQLTDN
jgi:hypothetical protein